MVSDINPTQTGRTVEVQGVSLRRYAAIRLLPARSDSGCCERSSEWDEPLWPMIGAPRANLGAVDTV